MKACARCVRGQMLADYGDGQYVCVQCGHRETNLIPLPIVQGPTKRVVDLREYQGNFRCGHPKDADNRAWADSRGQRVMRCKECYQSYNRDRQRAMRIGRGDDEASALAGDAPDDL